MIALGIANGRSHSRARVSFFLNRAPLSLQYYPRAWLRWVSTYDLLKAASALLPFLFRGSFGVVEVIRAGALVARCSRSVRLDSMLIQWGPVGASKLSICPSPFKDLFSQLSMVLFLWLCLMRR